MATSTIPKPMDGVAIDKFNNSVYTVAYKVGSTVFVTCVNFAYYCSADGVLHVGSASGAAWTLPEGFRPPQTVETCDTLNGKRINIKTNGDITCLEALSGVNLRFSACFLSDDRLLNL